MPLVQQKRALSSIISSIIISVIHTYVFFLSFLFFFFQKCRPLKNLLNHNDTVENVHCLFYLKWLKQKKIKTISSVLFNFSLKLVCIASNKNNNKNNNQTLYNWIVSLIVSKRLRKKWSKKNIVKYKNDLILECADVI